MDQSIYSHFVSCCFPTITFGSGYFTFILNSTILHCSWGKPAALPSARYSIRDSLVLNSPHKKDLMNFPTCSRCHKETMHFLYSVVVLIGCFHAYRCISIKYIFVIFDIFEILNHYSVKKCNAYILQSSPGLFLLPERAASPPPGSPP